MIFLPPRHDATAPPRGVMRGKGNMVMLCSGDHGVQERFIAKGSGPSRLNSSAAMVWEL